LPPPAGDSCASAGGGKRLIRVTPFPRPVTFRLWSKAQHAGYYSAMLQEWALSLVQHQKHREMPSIVAVFLKRLILHWGIAIAFAFELLYLVTTRPPTAPSHGGKFFLMYSGGIQSIVSDE